MSKAEGSVRWRASRCGHRDERNCRGAEGNEASLDADTYECCPTRLSVSRTRFGPGATLPPAPLALSWGVLSAWPRWPVLGHALALIRQQAPQPRATQRRPRRGTGDGWQCGQQRSAGPSRASGSPASSAPAVGSAHANFPPGCFCACPECARRRSRARGRQIHRISARSATSASGAMRWFFRSLRMKRRAAALSRRLWTNTSRTSPSLLTARQRYICRPAIFTNISPRCQLRADGPRQRRKCLAISGPKRATQTRTVAQVTRMPRSASSSSTSRRLRVNRR